MVLDVQLRLHDLSKTSCEGITGISHFSDDVSASWLNSGVGGLPCQTGDYQSVTAHASDLELHSTQLNSLRVLPVSFSRERGRRRREVSADGARLLARIYWRRLPLSRMSLTATWNLKDCSIDALNYAQTMLSDQTNSCSHQVHGVLVFECTVRSLCLFVVRNNSSCPFFFSSSSSYFLYGNKMVEWIWTFHFFVFGLSTLILYSGTNCVCV